MITLAIVCPCYNEEEVLPVSADRLLDLIERMQAQDLISQSSFILFVNDGSRDSTWNIISDLHRRDSRFKALDLTRNVGHQNAIMAGMLEAAPLADGVVTIDVDLQDDIECIPQMVKAYEEGYDVVYGVKTLRDTDTFLKRFTATAFYRLREKMGVETVFNHADFRFLSRNAINELTLYQERNLYLRGIIPMMGCRSTTVNYELHERTAGKTKYTVRKMMTLALDGITSFSVRPVYWILGLGVTFVMISLLAAIYVLVAYCTGNAVHGWSSLMLSIWFVGGCVLLSVGMVGLYVGRVFIETKHRPLYHIREKIL